MCEPQELLIGLCEFVAVIARTGLVDSGILGKDHVDLH
jgi:hypothetical protein